MRSCLFCSPLCLLLGLALPPVPPLPATQLPLSQVQVARHFLLELLAGNWDDAYQRLSPETRQQLSAPAFRAAAQPVITHALTYGPVIDLYKLGYRLREEQAAQPFVAFSYRADSLRPGPHVQLDVTFQDSAARTVQHFSIVRLRP